MVVSRIDKKVNYIENKKLESKDNSKKRNLYELQIANEKRRRMAAILFTRTLLCGLYLQKV